MQRLNKSGHAPLGTTFFLFLSLAIVPVSLRAAGFQIDFSPRLTAAIDAWQQIADVFGASYQAAPASELSVVRDPDGDCSNPVTVSAPSNQFACNRTAAQCSGTVREIPKVRAPRPNRVVREANRPELWPSAAANRVALFVAAKALNENLQKISPAVAALRSIKVQALVHESLAQNDERVLWKSLESIDNVRNLQIPRNVRVMVRPKRAAGSSSKTAECKVSAALASAVRHDCDRAMLIGMPSATPDNSEF